ncbi:MAG: hypothetical protein WAZ12_04215 [Candidatus Absconditicoccaceae bacterium]
MIDQFELLLDLLNIEDKQYYMDTAKQIEKKQHKRIKTRHKHGFVFEVYNDFLDHKISLEDFVKIGDIEGGLDISQVGFDLDSLSVDGQDIADTLFIVSLVDIGRKFSNKEIDEIKKKLTMINSQLCII